MVFVPRQYLVSDALGVGGALPRAVPADAAVALLTTVVPGQVLQKLVLVGLVVAAVLGAARLGPRGPGGVPGVGSVAAAAVYGWSPYLAERLLMGHWSLLLAWAALPWVLVSAAGLRAGRPGATGRLVVVLACAALTPTGSLLAGTAAVVAAGRRRAAGIAAATLALAAPWIVAGILHPATADSDPAGVAAFAARPDGLWGGVVLSLLGGGGIWNAEAVPAGRGSPVTPLVTLVLLGLAAVGWFAADARHGRGVRVLVLGGAGLALASAGALPGLSGVLDAAVVDLPGGGLLRDGQKWVLWWLPALAIGVGAGVDRLARLRALATPRSGAVAGVAVVLLAALTVPDLAWGVGGRLRPVPYPPDWDRVVAAVAGHPAPGAVLVLPVGAVRSFGWNGGRPQLDPAPRYLPRAVVVTDDLVVAGRTVAGQDPRARAVTDAAADPVRLAGLGVGWVLIEHGTPGRPLPDWVRTAPRTVSGPWLDLVRIPGARTEATASTVRVASVISAHLLALIVLGSAALMLVRSHVIVAARRMRHRFAEVDTR